MEKRSKLALQNYLELISPEAAKKVRVAQHEKLSSAECFLMFYWNAQLGFRVPFYVSMPEINRIEGEFARIYGRTPWGPWTLLTIHNFTIIKTLVVLDARDDERIKYLEDYINDFEVK